MYDKFGRVLRIETTTNEVLFFKHHLKSDHRMHRCWLQAQLGDALHAVLCATGYNLRWLLRAMVRLGLKAAFCALFYLR